MKKISFVSTLLLVLMITLGWVNPASAQRLLADLPARQQPSEINFQPDKTVAVALSSQTEFASNELLSGGPDGYGYWYLNNNENGGPVYSWIDAVTGGTNLNLDDTTEANITLPFAFTYYGVSSTSLRVGNNGAVLFNTTTGDVPDTNACPLSGSTTNNIFGPWWDDWGTPGDVYWQVFGSAPTRYVVIEWYNMQHFSAGAGDYATFEMVLYENSTDIIFQYADTDVTGTAYDNGLSGTAGIRQSTAANSLQYSICNSSHLTNNLAIRFFTANAPSFTSSFKSAPAMVENGGELDYIVHIINNGNVAAANASMYDVIPAGVDYLPGSLACSSGLCGYGIASDTITWTGSLAVGASALVTFTVDVANASCGASILNTAVISDTDLIGSAVNKQAVTSIAYTLLVLSESFDVTPFPPSGWGQTIVTDPGTDPVWTRETAGTSPVINPHTGAAMAKFNSYNATSGASARLFTSSLDFSTSQMPVLKFWMSHYSSTTNDRIQIQVSTDDGTTWTNVGAAIPRYDAACTTACWKEHSQDLSAYAGLPDVRIGFLGLSAYGYNIFIDDISIGEPWAPCPYITLGADKTGYTCPGNTSNYQVSVSNFNNISDTLNLTWMNNWPTTVTPNSFDLGPGGNGTANVSVYVPWANQAGDSDTAQIDGLAQTSGLADQTLIKTIVPLASGWIDLANAPHSLRQSSVVYYNGSLYVIGGYDGSARNYVDIYNIATNTWSSGTPLPTATYRFDCAEIDGSIYCAGGYTTAGSSALNIYNIAANTWSTGASMSAARYDYAGVALNGKYYVIGGYNATSPYYYNTIWEYDPLTNTWNYSLPTMSTPRYYESAGVINGRIYVAGGYSGSTSLTTLEIFDPAGPSWSSGAAMPSAWMNAADGVKHNRFLIMSGGFSNTYTASNQGLVYDSVTNTWNWLTSLPRSLYQAEGDSDGTHFWMVGGYTTTYINNTTRMEQCAACTPVTNADFIATPPSGAPNSPIAFNASASGSPAITYSWDFGDSSTGTGQAITHTFAAAGTYTVTLTASNCDGADVTTVTHAITISAGPQISVSPNSLSSTQCSDTQAAEVMHICNIGDDPLEWILTDVSTTTLWLSGTPLTGTLSSNTCQAITITFDSTGQIPGVYTTTLEVASNDATHPSVLIPVQMTVPGAASDVDFSWNPLSPNMYQDVTFTGQATAQLPVTYSWAFGDGITGTNQMVSHAYNTWGDFTVSMTAQQCNVATVVTHTVSVASCWSLLDENFESTFPPVGWTVDNHGLAHGWMRNDQVPTGRPNYAGGQGYSAAADVDRFGSGSIMNTELRSTVLDLSNVTTATLQYVAAYNWYSGAEYANTDISTDGGATWTNVVHWISDHNPVGPGEQVSVDLTPYVGSPDTLVRFYYYAPAWDYWFQVDQVNVLGCYVPGAVPDIVITPESITQTLPVSQTTSQVLDIGNMGLGQLHWSINEGCGTPVSWLSENPISGTVPAYSSTGVDVTFNTVGLFAGTYQSSLCLESDDPDQPIIPVTVTMNVTGEPVILVSPLTLTQTLGPDSNADQNVNIANLGTSNLNWYIDEGCGTPVSWLTEIPDLGIVLPTENTDVTVTFDTTGLIMGTYQTSLCVNSDDPSQPTVTISVTLNVIQAIIDVNPTALMTTIQPDIQTTETFTISNMGNIDLSWNLFEEFPPRDAIKANCESPADIPWASASPIAGDVAPEGTQPVDVTFDSTGLAVGTYAANLCIASNDVANSLVVLPITMTVSPYVVTFTYLDLEDVVHSGEALYLAGSFNGWNATATPMTPNADFSAFSVDVGFPATGDIEYKYIVYTDTIPSGPANWNWVQSNNRMASVSGDTTITDYRYVQPGWYDLQWPYIINIPVGFPSPTIYGQIWADDLTARPGAPRALMAELGYGTDHDPASWSTWQPMTWGSQVGNNDEFIGSITFPITGTFHYAVRYRTNFGTGNPHDAWIYADRNGGDFDINDAGLATIFPFQADLSLAMSSPISTVLPGEIITFTILISNSGPADATLVVLTDTLPVGVTFVSASTGCTASQGSVICILGTINAGDSQSILIVVTAPDHAGTLSNTAIVESNVPDPDPANNTATAEVEVSSPPVTFYRLYLPTVTRIPGGGKR